VDRVHRRRTGVIVVMLLALAAACGGGETALTTADLERADAPARRATRAATSLPATTTTTEQPPTEEVGDADEPGPPADPAPSADAETTGENEVAWRVVVDEPTVPDEPGFAFADIVTERDDLGPVWSRFGLQATFVDVHLERELLLVAGFGESGSCPARAHGLDVEDDVVTLHLGTELTADTYVGPGDPWPEDVGCTGDYRPRTLVLAVERRGFPEGAFAFVHEGTAFSLATLPLQAPPPTPAPPGSAGPRLDVDLVVEPAGPAVGDTVTVDLVNRTDRRVDLSWTVALDRWDAQRWRPAPGQHGSRDHPAITLHERAVEPGQTATVAEVDTATMAPGWYAVWTRVGGEDAVQDRRAVFELR
jgi:hypothetical protein